MAPTDRPATEPTADASGAEVLVAGSRPWLRRIFDDDIATLPGVWHFATTPAELDDLLERHPAIRRIYFLHWSWKVPDELLERIECINFHMTDVPYGRGGSPLQNLIVAGKQDTVLSAIGMTAAFDAGPVYLKRPLPLHGAAEAVYHRAARLSALMIAEIQRDEPVPVEQRGDVVEFARRRPHQSRIEDPTDLDEVHDFIRMLDAEGYPHAFVELGALRLEFRRAVRYADSVVADVTFRRREERRP